MLTPRARRPARRTGLLALTAGAAGAATVVALTAGAAPARADAVRDAQMWVLNAVNAPSAWRVTQGQGVTVAVIDSGVNASASDLSGSVTTGPDLTGVHTPVSNSEWGMHGTWMASLIAGHGHGGGDDSGIMGVAPRARILSVRVITNNGDPGYARYERQSQALHQSELATAIGYAISRGAQVISMSLGSGAPSLAVRSALQNALNHNIVILASSGNSGNAPSVQQQGQAPYSFPADYPGVLGVGAIGQNGAPANFSSDNLSVQVAAPGINVPAQGKDGDYWLVSGTSPACALTAGVAALIRSVYPALPPVDVRKAITSTTSDRPRGGWDDQVGFGTVDAAAALAEAARLSAKSGAKSGVSSVSHFGGGSAAIPAAPIASRGLQQLVEFCLLAAICLAMIVIAASRLLLMRRPLTAGDQLDDPRPDGFVPGPRADGAWSSGGTEGDGHPPGSPRFPWSPAPPGRHVLPHDQQGATGPGE
jgi:type VII secretion-associated serine protease mycosin